MYAACACVHAAVSELCDGGVSSQSYGSGTVTWPCAALRYCVDASERRAAGYGYAAGDQSSFFAAGSEHATQVDKDEQ